MLTQIQVRTIGRVLLAFVIIVLLLAVMLIYAVLHQHAVTQTIDAARVSNNRDVIKKCHDQKLCMGGFLRWTYDESSIYRIGPTGDVNFRVVALSQLIDMQYDDKRLNQIEYIRIPSDNAWNITAGAHARQFVWQP